MLGFGIVVIMGVNPDEDWVGDVVMEITHNGFYTYAQVWMRIRDGVGGWESTCKLQRQYHYISYLA